MLSYSIDQITSFSWLYMLMNRNIPIIGKSNLIYLLKIPPTIRSSFLVLKNESVNTNPLKLKNKSTQNSPSIHRLNFLTIYSQKGN